MMLAYLGENKWAERIEEAILTVLATGNTLTPDIGGIATTREVTKAIIAALDV